MSQAQAALTEIISAEVDVHFEKRVAELYKKIEGQVLPLPSALRMKVASPYTGYDPTVIRTAVRNGRLEANLEEGTNRIRNIPRVNLDKWVADGAPTKRID